jgi:ribosomal protein S6--L-glutamate ligase
MRIAILSSGDGWHVQDLLRASRELGHEAVPVDFRKIQAGVSVDVAAMDGFDRAMVRTMPPGSLEQVVFRMDVLHRLEAAGIPVLNPPRAIETCVDKYLATAKLQAAGLPVPPTVVCQHADAAMEALPRLGGDVVVKPLFGSEGRGMVRLSEPELAWRTFRAIERMNSVIYLQQFVPNPGWDLRVFVIAGRVLAAMCRYADGDWRTNVAQGGKAVRVTLKPAEEELALRAAAAVGAPMCGVDLLPDRDGRLFVLEVNSVPGWRALAPTTGVDVAARLIRFLVDDYRTT